MEPSFDRTSRIRIADFITKLAVRMQKVSRRPVDPAKASTRLDQALNGRLSELGIKFSSKTSKESPRLVKVLANRTFLPGHGDGLRADMFFGPLKLVETAEGLGVLTSGTMGNVDEIKPDFSSVFGGMSRKVELITADARKEADREYRVETALRDGRRVWSIVHAVTGEIAYYQNPKIEEQNEAELKKPESERTFKDPYQKAFFTSATEATKVLNVLTRGRSSRSRPLPKFKEFTVYVKYSAVYLKDHPSDNIGAGVFDVLDDLLPLENQERSQEMEHRLKEELQRSEKTVEQRRRDLEQKQQDMLNRQFRQNMGKRSY